MTSMVGRGLVAGAVGTTALNAVTYLDMAIRGRPASTVPEAVVDTVVSAVGGKIPGNERELAHRREALGSLGGTAVGLGLGVGASALRRLGFRPSPVTGSVLVGAAAMAATDVPMAVSGVSHPRAWTTADWLADVVPHLAFGIGTHATLTTVDGAGQQSARHRPTIGLLMRSALLGVAAGGRSSLAIAAPVLTAQPAHGLLVRAAAVAGLGGELVADKLPSTPSRLNGAVPFARICVGKVGAAVLARRSGARPFLPVLAGGAGAVLGTWAGATWRSWAADRMPDVAAALVEDAVAITLAALAVRRAAGDAIT